ncbi:MAG: iron-containing alcohol dehydrogenase, partial [Treponema sp.]|nr:iron-containing alcohol dehydrogenase [Treponema sp.]
FLTARGVFTTIRASRGQDIFAACGLLSTDRKLRAAGLTDSVQKTLGKIGMESAVFNDIIGEPTDTMIYEGVSAFKKEKCDFIIGLGGGSPLDSAKAIAAMSVLPGKMADYIGKEIEADIVPLVLIPTTAGTGSEATKYFVYTDTNTNSKLLMKGECLLPKIAVIDYTYTMSSPPSVTTNTGMDALTHAIESYTCRKSTPVTDLFCIDAVKRIFKYLPQALKDGSDRTARENLAIASYEAGVAINTSPTTIVHGMSRPIGALFHVPHGISNAMILTECLKAVMEGCYERFARLGIEIGAATESDSPKAGAEKFIKALEDFSQKLKIPTLRVYGINLEEFAAKEEKMAADSLASGSPSNCWKILTKEEEIKIYDILRNK